LQTVFCSSVGVSKWPRCLQTVMQEDKAILEKLAISWFSLSSTLKRNVVTRKLLHSGCVCFHWYFLRGELICVCVLPYFVRGVVWGMVALFFFFFSRAQLFSLGRNTLIPFSRSEQHSRNHRGRLPGVCFGRSVPKWKESKRCSQAHRYTCRSGIKCSH
jgi:hypothetical protein